jgi:hypothetical protein
VISLMASQTRTVDAGFGIAAVCPACLCAYSLSITGTANCHCRFSRAFGSVSNGPSVQLCITSPFVVLASTFAVLGQYDVDRYLDLKHYRASGGHAGFPLRRPDNPGSP